MDLVTFLGCEEKFGSAEVALVMVATLIEDSATVMEAVTAQVVMKQAVVAL